MLTKLGEITDLNMLSALQMAPDVLPFTKFGYGTIGSSFSTIYSPGPDPGVYEYMSEQGKIAFASTSPLDTALGTGARLIRATGVWIDPADGLIKVQSEEIPTSGQTPSVSTKDFLRVYTAKVVDFVSHDLVGQGYIGPEAVSWIGGEPDHVLAHINDGMNRTQMMTYTAPSDYLILVQSIVITSGTGKEATIIAVSREQVKNRLVDDYVFEIVAQWITDTHPIPVDLAKNPFWITPESEFEFRAKVETGSLNVSVNMTGLMVPTKYFGKYPHPWCV